MMAHPRAMHAEAGPSREAEAHIRGGKHDEGDGPLERISSSGRIAEKRGNRRAPAIGLRTTGDGRRQKAVNSSEGRQLYRQLGQSFPYAPIAQRVELDQAFVFVRSGRVWRGRGVAAQFRYLGP